MMVFGFILCSVTVRAQADQEEVLLNYSREISSRGNRAVAERDYPRAEKLLREFLRQFARYPEELQQKYQTALGSCYYNLACYTALQHKRKTALNAFAKAIEYGWCNYSHARSDSDLDFIRDDDRFKKLMESIRAKGDYLYILQQSGEYVQGNDDCGQLRFTYMGSGDADLMRVRHHFNLDSIAGSGDEISKMKRLLTWVHDEVRHDGSSDNPQSRNAIDLIELCRKEQRGVNCRMLAQILNECYLAMGFKSRFVTCMPQVYVGDCHVINAVYSDSLRKWVWMDPTYNAWVMDEDGQLLGIGEVRERLKNGQPLLLNEEANWNQKKQTKAAYLEAYMAKNLYYLSGPLRSEFNAETNYEGKTWSPYVTLIPLGYQLEADRRTDYVTHDDQWFWQLPDTGDQIKK